MMIMVQNERKRKTQNPKTYFPDNTQSNGIQYIHKHTQVPLFHQTFGAHKKLPYKSKWEKRLKKKQTNKKY